MAKKPTRSKSSKSRPHRKPVSSSSDQSDQDVLPQEVAPERVLVPSDEEDEIHPQDLLGLADDGPEQEDPVDACFTAAFESHPEASEAEGGQNSPVLGAVVGSRPQSEGLVPEDSGEAKDPSEILQNSEEKDAPLGEDLPVVESGERQSPIADFPAKLAKGDASQVPQHSLLQNDSELGGKSAQNFPVNYFRPLASLPSLTSLLSQRGLQRELANDKIEAQTKGVSVLLASKPPEHRQAAHGGEARLEGHGTITENKGREVPVPKVRRVEAPPLPNKNKAPGALEPSALPKGIPPAPPKDAAGVTATLTAASASLSKALATTAPKSTARLDTAAAQRSASDEQVRAVAGGGVRSAKHDAPPLFPRLKTVPATHDERVGALLNLGWRHDDVVRALEASKDEQGQESMSEAQEHLENLRLYRLQSINSSQTQTHGRSEEEEAPDKIREGTELAAYVAVNPDHLDAVLLILEVHEGSRTAHNADHFRTAANLMSQPRVRERTAYLPSSSVRSC